MLFWLVRSREFEIISRGGLRWIECVALARIPWLLHAFSTRCGGVSPGPAGLDGTEVLNLGAVDWDRGENVARNREIFVHQISAGDFRLATLRQVHSADVFRVFRGRTGNIEYQPSSLPCSATFDKPARLKLSRPAVGGEGAYPQDGASDAAKRETGDPKSQIPNRQPTTDPAHSGDALITDEPGVLLSVRSADCMPVLLVDPHRRAIAAIHAGWRGALGRIIENTVRDLCRACGSRPENLIAVMGPSIRACCYEIGEEVANAFRQRFAPPGRSASVEDFFKPTRKREAILRRRPSQPSTAARTGSVSLDLVAVARHQLLAAGFCPAQIHVANFCTACRTDLFFSYRKQGHLAGRMMAVVGMRRLND